ncbi:MAG: phosphotransferase family protein [Cellulosilyticaceae bacterium]
MSDSKIYRELSLEELNKIINSHFNTIDFTYTILNGGMFNTTYLINLSNTKKYVLRVGPINRHLLLPFEHNLMIAEDYFYKLCKSKNLPTPEIVCFETNKLLIDRDYMITRYIESICLSSEHIVPDNKVELYKEVGTITKSINGIEGGKFGRLGDIALGGGYSQWSDFITKEFEITLQFLQNFNVYTAVETKDIYEIILTYKNVLNEITTPYLIHTDLWDGNVLVSCSQDAIVAIIDGDRALFGDANFELASGWIVNDYFFEGYGKHEYYDRNTLIRNTIYKLLYKIIDAYVLTIEYNNKKDGLVAKENACKLLNQLK